MERNEISPKKFDGVPRKELESMRQNILVSFQALKAMNRVFESYHLFLFGVLMGAIFSVIGNLMVTSSFEYFNLRCQWYLYILIGSVIIFFGIIFWTSRYLKNLSDKIIEPELSLFNSHMAKLNDEYEKFGIPFSLTEDEPND